MMRARTRLKHLFGVVAVGAMVAAPMLAPQAAQAKAFTYTVVQQYDMIPVAVGSPCSGDLVTFSGTQNTVFHLTSDGAGATHVDSEFNFQGVSGVGDATGANYQLVGHGTSEFNATTEGTFEATIEISTNMVGQGPDNNSYVVTLYHLTLADGNPTSTVDSLRIDCR